MKRFISSAAWLLIGHIGRMGAQLIGVSIIARLLTPADFGVVAIAMTASNLAGLLRDLGTGPAAVRSRDASPQFLGGIYSVQLLISVTLAVVLVASAPALGRFYAAPALSNVLVIFALVFPITALGSVHLIVLERAMRYREISIIELVSYAAGLGVAVLLARAGVGVESLAYQPVANAVVQTVLVRLRAGVALAPAHPRHARSAARGSAAVTSFQLFNYLARNLDSPVAGKLATTAFVGSYSMATRLSQLPAQAIGMLLSRASLPMLAGADRDDPSLSRDVAAIGAIALWASAGACLMLASLRTTITAVLFGHQWLETVPGQLQWLLPAAALASMSTALVGIMTGLGAGRSLVFVGAAGALGHVAAVTTCMIVDPLRLPIAVTVSSGVGLLAAVTGLQGLLSRRGLTRLGGASVIPVLLVIAYPLLHAGLAWGGGAWRRTVVHEIVEAVAVAGAMAPLVFQQWRHLRRARHPAPAATVCQA